VACGADLAVVGGDGDDFGAALAFLDDGALDALAADFFQEVGITQVAAPATPRVSNCLNTVNSTMAMTSQTATLENH
jgi:hypothetical protein